MITQYFPIIDSRVILINHYAFFFKSMTLNCIICDSRAGLQHHIIPRREGGKNSVSNMLLLCFSCHQSVERQTIGAVMKATLERINKDESWFFLRLYELGITKTPYKPVKLNVLCKGIYTPLRYIVLNKT